jgi:hypothetical protein
MCVKFLDYMVNMFNFLRNHQTVFPSCCTILHFHQQYMKVLNYSHPVVYLSFLTSFPLLPSLPSPFLPHSFAPPFFPSSFPPFPLLTPFISFLLPLYWQSEVVYWAIKIFHVFVYLLWRKTCSSPLPILKFVLHVVDLWEIFIYFRY